MTLSCEMPHPCKCTDLNGKTLDVLAHPPKSCGMQATRPFMLCERYFHFLLSERYLPMAQQACQIPSHPSNSECSTEEKEFFLLPSTEPFEPSVLKIITNYCTMEVPTGANWNTGAAPMCNRGRAGSMASTLLTSTLPDYTHTSFPSRLHFRTYL